MRAVLGVGLAGVVLAGMVTAPPTVAAEEPVAQAATLQRKTDVPPPGSTVEAKLNPAPPLAVQVLEASPARVGGRGSVQISVVRQDPKGPALRNVRVALQTSTASARLTSAKGAGWRCKAAKGELTCTRKRLARGISPGTLLARVATPRKAPKQRARISAEVTWAGMKQFRAALVGKKGRTVSQVRNIGSIDVYPRLRASLSSPMGRTVQVSTGLGAQPRAILLAAKVRSGGGQVIGTWRQLSGPKVRFAQDRRVVGVKKKLGQTVLVPKRMRGTKTMRFGLTLKSGGVQIQRTLKIRVQSSRTLGEVAPRHGQLRKLAKSSKKRVKLLGLRQSGKDPVRLVVKPGEVVNAGQQVTVRARIATKVSAKVADIWWFTHSGSPATDTGIRGYTAKLRAPRVPGDRDVITAVVTLRNGRQIQSSKVISARLPSSGDNDTGDKKANVATFCKVLDAVKSRKGQQNIVLLDDPDGGDALQTLSFYNGSDKISYDDSAYKNRTCTGEGAITFGAATLKQANGDITDASGTITAQKGVEITGGTWKRPAFAGDSAAGWKQMEVKGSVKAGLKSGKWQPLAGSLSVPGGVGPVNLDRLSLIELPGGWHLKAPEILFVNADPDKPDELIKDGTLQFRETMSGPNEGAAELGIDFYRGKSDLLHVSVANLLLGTTADGNNLQASGSGDVKLDRSDWRISLDVLCATSKVALSNDCEIFEHFALEDAKLFWSAEKIDLSAKAKVTYGEGREYGFDLDGSYASAEEWEFAAKSTTPFPIVDDITMTKVDGSLRREKVPGSSKTHLVGAFDGIVTGMQFASGIKVGQVTGTLTNACPPSLPTCGEGDLRLDAQADVTTPLPGNADPVSLTARAQVDLTTLDWTFKLAVSDISIGPSVLNVTSATFIISNGRDGVCTPKDQKIGAGVFSVGLLANGRILGNEVMLGGGFGKSGQCLFATPKSLNVRDGMKAGSNLLTYASYPGGATFDIPGRSQPVTTDKSDDLALNGSFQMPDQVKQFFKISGDLEYDAHFSKQDKSFDFAIDYRAPDPGINLYTGDGASLNVTKIGFRVDYGTSATELKAFAGGVLALAGNPQKGIVSSTTEMGVSLGFSIKPQAVSFTIQAGVETGPDQRIDGAFGQKGLVLQQLAIKAEVAVPVTASSISLNAQAQLPASWTAGAKLPTNAHLALELDTRSPCILFELGNDQATPYDPPVMNIGNGLVTATYLKLLIAPKGCTVPVGASGSQQLPAGYGFAFVGSVVGTSIDIVVNVGFSDGFTMKGHVKADKLNLYAVKLTNYEGNAGPDIVFDVDSKQGKYDVAIDAALEVGSVKYGAGGRVRVDGQVKTSGQDAFTVDLRGDGEIALGPLKAQIQKLNAHVVWYKDADKASKSVANVEIGLRVGALGVYLGADGYLSYANQQVEMLGISVVTGVNVVVGHLDGRVAFDYCLGELTMNDQLKRSTCSLFVKRLDASPAYRVSVAGSIGLFGWSKDWSWIAFDQKGKEGSKAPGPDLNPQSDRGAMPDKRPRVMSAAMLAQNHDLVSAQGWTMKSMYPDQVVDGSRTYQPCENVIFGTYWQPEGNPIVGTPNPHKDPCGLQVSMAQGTAAPIMAKVICEVDACRLLGAGTPLTVEGGTAGAARDKLLAGLRTPPGVIPAGAMIDRPVNSPDGRYQLNRTDAGFVLKDMNNGGRVVWAAEATWNKPLTRGFVRPDAVLEATDGAKNSVVVGKSGSVVDGSDEPYLLIQDGLSLFYDQGKRLQWGVNAAGECLPFAQTCVGDYSGDYRNPTPLRVNYYWTSFQTGLPGGRCLDAASASNGSQLRLWDCNKSGTQDVKVYPDRQQMLLMGKCLDVRDGSSANETPIQITDCNGGPAQKFTYDPPTQQLRVLGKCVDVYREGTGNGTPLILYSCKQSPNQSWRRYNQH